VRPAGRARRLAGEPAGRLVQPQHLAVVGDLQVLAGQALAVGDGRGQHPGHALGALERRGLRRLGGGRGHARVQLGGRGQEHAGLAQ
jgi:hypothetical protein